ncbi:MAG: hypothetical protein ACE369_12930 [Roseovarius sp.]
MKRLYPLALALAALLPGAALACEPPAIFYVPFEHAAQGADPAGIAAFVSRTKPVVANTSVARGAPGEPSLCGGMGYIDFEIALPPGAPFSFGQIGVEIRLAEGRFHDHVFPKGPVMPHDPSDRTLHLGNAWYDGQPSEQQPINAAFNVVLVAPDGTRGPATRIVLKSRPNAASRKEGGTR